MKFAEFYGVLDRRISRQNSNCKVLADVLNPTALANRAQPERDRFIEASGRHFGRMLDPFKVADRDAARTNRHSGSLA